MSVNQRTGGHTPGSFFVSKREAMTAVVTVKELVAELLPAVKVKEAYNEKKTCDPRRGSGA